MLITLGLTYARDSRVSIRVKGARMQLLGSEFFALVSLVELDFARQREKLRKLVHGRGPSNHGRARRNFCPWLAMITWMRKTEESRRHVAGRAQFHDADCGGVWSVGRAVNGCRAADAWRRWNFARFGGCQRPAQKVISQKSDQAHRQSVDNAEAVHPRLKRVQRFPIGRRKPHGPH